MEIIIVALIVLFKISKYKDLVLFYHIGAVSERINEILYRQWTLIYSSKLYKQLDTIFIGIVGTYPSKILEKIRKNKKVIFINNFNKIKSNFEDYTLHILYHFSKHMSDTNIIYIHSRGVTYQVSEIRNDNWTKIMEYFIIEKWERNIEYMENYYTLGCQLTGTPYPLNGGKWGLMYFGNFWWCNSDYIKTLPDPHEFTFQGENRLAVELWVVFNFLKSINKHLILFHTDGRGSNLCRQKECLLDYKTNPNKYDSKIDIYSYYYTQLPRYQDSC